MIHKILKNDVAELNRVLELIQKDLQTPGTNSPRNAASVGGASSAGATASIPGPQGQTGPTGKAGAMNADKLIVARSEEEEIIVNNAGSVVTDQYGWAVTGIKEQWVLVTDNNGNILTLE